MESIEKETEKQNENERDDKSLDQETFIESNENTTNQTEEEGGSGKSSETEQQKTSVKRILLEAVLYIFLIFLCIFVVPKYVIQRTIVKGNSMEDTLNNKDNLIVNKISLRFGDPKRFDIVVFYPHGRKEEDYFVKRVIGLPGEEIRISGDDIYINGEVLEEDFGKNPITSSGIAEEPILLAQDEYFLMGDNRSISLDSRSSDVGPVKRDLIEGKVVLRIWPLNKFGTLH